MRAIEWRVHLASRNPKGLPLVALVMALSGLLGALKGWAYAVLGPVLVLLWVADYLFPVTYRLTDEGVEVRQLVLRAFLPWERVRRCVKTKGGLFLSPLPKPSRLDAYRGVFLREVPPEAEELVRKKAQRARWAEGDAEAGR
ncbi:MAG TPA: hypothetical protein EYP65_04365 [Armatimonadetes bacterium]|nr:hypothetical protein [Armatimonadota bacterium]